MSTHPYSRQALLDFLDFLSSKGLMNKATAVSRKAAVNTLLSILSEQEAENVKDLDLDVLLTRFSHLKGSDFKPASLRVYKARLTSVLSDYERYKRDPLGYKPNTPTKERSPRDQPIEPKASGSTAKSTSTRPPIDPEEERVEEIVFPIPIRKGVIVKVAGIPSDLTPEEATKIGNVILALSGSQETITH